jgi:Holliday junction resolvase RusA-like endonuclease
MTKTGYVYNPDGAKAWKEAVILAAKARQIETIEKPVRLSVDFYLPCPKRLKQGTPHVGKPDVDNLLKSTMDALTNAGVWKDDSLVYAVNAEKCRTPGKCGAFVEICTE